MPCKEKYKKIQKNTKIKKNEKRKTEKERSEQLTKVTRQVNQRITKQVK